MTSETNSGKLQLLGGCIAILWGACLWLFGPGLHEHIEATVSVPVDWHKYVAMASKPVGAFKIAPFCHRLVVPWIASVMPFQVMTNFALIQFGALCLLGVGVTRATLRVGISGGNALLPLTWLLGLGWVAKASFAVVPSVDLVAWSAIVWFFALALESRLVLALMAAVLAVTIKEASLVAIASSLLLVYEYQRVHKWFPALVIACSLGVLLLLNVALPPANMDSAYTSTLSPMLSIVNGIDSNASVLHSLITIGWPRIANLSLTDLNALTFDSFGVCFIVAIAYVWKTQGRTPWSLVASTLLSMSIALVAVNIQRPILIAAPILVVGVWAKMPLSRFRQLITYSASIIAICTIFTQRESVSTVFQLGIVVVVAVGYQSIRRVWSRL